MLTSMHGSKFSCIVPLNKNGSCGMIVRDDLQMKQKSETQFHFTGSDREHISKSVWDQKCMGPYHYKAIPQVGGDPRQQAKG